MPIKPTERLDTMLGPNFNLIMLISQAEVSNELSFAYSLYFPTNINEYDLFQMKKDSNALNILFESMISGAEKNSNSEVVAKTYFNFPEPGVKITFRFNDTKDITICRIIIFDNYVISTNSTGTNDEFSIELEDRFFKSLKVNPKNRNREMNLN
jgi:hypothetical protein